MKKSLIPLAAVILALVATSAGVLALTGGDSTPILSSEGIDPDVCNLIHNITACDQDDLDRLGEDSSLPVNPDADKDASCEPVPLRSDCGIDPNECNLIHNITACDQDDFDRLGEDSSLPVNPDADKDASCEPVPLRSDCDIDPAECNQIHNIDACGVVLDPPGPVDEPAGDGGDYFQVTIRFNTSYTQEDIDEVDAFLRTFDDDLEFIIMEIFPPIGSALLTLETSDECWTIEAQLEAKSYVSDVTCEPWQPNGEVEPGDFAEQTN